MAFCGRSHLLGGMQEFVPVIAPLLRDGGEEEAQAHAPAAVFLGEIGADEERLLLRRQDRGQGPAAAAVCRDAGLHVYAVHIRALLAVDLDGDIGFVQDLGHACVLKGLVRHDVAPVAGGIADGEEDGLVLPPRLLERLLPPGEPVHGVFRVLSQIRGFFVYQSIAHRGLRKHFYYCSPNKFLNFWGAIFRGCPA